jgi:hypothetical protein
MVRVKAAGTLVRWQSDRTEARGGAVEVRAPAPANEVIDLAWMMTIELPPVWCTSCKRCSAGCANRAVSEALVEQLAQ